MHILILLFIFMHFYYLFNTREIYYILNQYIELAKLNKSNPAKKHVVVVNSTILFFIMYMALDFFYMFFCLYLLSGDAYWQQGGMLFILSSLEAYAYHMRISYTCQEDPEGFVYPSTWCSCLLTGASLFILSRLYASI